MFYNKLQLILFFRIPGELEADEPNVVFNVRQKLCTLSSCFAQLTHKAQTIFQNSAKIEVRHFITIQTISTYLFNIS